MHQVIEFYEQNLRLARETGDHRAELSALGSLGRAYDALEERDKAIACYEQALIVARSVGDARSERHMLKSLNETLNANNASNVGNTDNDLSAKGKTARTPRKKAAPAKAKTGKAKTASGKSTKKPSARKARSSATGTTLPTPDDSLDASTDNSAETGREAS